MTASTTPDGQPQVTDTRMVCTGADALPLVRGLLAEGIRRCPPTSDAALELCAAWEHLEERGRLPRILDPAVASTVPAAAVLGTAREMLCTAILTIEPARRALDLAAAVRHIDRALADLTRRATDPAARS